MLEPNELNIAYIHGYRWLIFAVFIISDIHQFLGGCLGGRHASNGRTWQTGIGRWMFSRQIFGMEGYQCIVLGRRWWSLLRGRGVLEGLILLSCCGRHCRGSSIGGSRQRYSSMTCCISFGQVGRWGTPPSNPSCSIIWRQWGSRSSRKSYLTSRRYMVHSIGRGVCKLSCNIGSACRQRLSSGTNEITS